MRRIFIRGEVQTRDAPDGAALWLRVERTGSPITDYGFDGRLQGGSDWTARSVSLPVPSDATRISYGVRLWGRGAVSARHLRMEVGAVLSPDAPLEASAAAVLQSALDIVKKNGLRRERVSWPVLEREVRTLASGATRTSDVYAAIGHLLAEATDPNHSSLRSPAQWAAMMNAGAETPLPVARVVDQAAGYIELPGHNTDDIRRNREYARRAHQLIEQIMPVAPCAWIVDVRRNGGGNVYPMLAALKPFLGDEALGSNVGPDGPESPRVAGQNSDVVPPPALASLETASVAVLVGPGTGSSGERVAISFRGRARTRLFGQPTRGATTANETFVLPDGARLVVTQSVMADRTGRTYGGRVEPDDVVSISLPGASATRSGDDPVLRAAVQWLRQGSGCLTQ
jgi:C-terminal processing protease CtpA/Prc